MRQFVACLSETCPPSLQIILLPHLKIAEIIAGDPPPEWTGQRDQLGLSSGAASHQGWGWPSASADAGEVRTDPKPRSRMRLFRILWHQRAGGVPSAMKHATKSSVGRSTTWLRPRVRSVGSERLPIYKSALTSIFRFCLMKVPSWLDRSYELY